MGSEHLKLFKRRTVEKCEIMFMSTFHETRTDRSPIPSKGGTFGMDRNVCGSTHRATLDQCFSLSQASTVVSQA